MSSVAIMALGLTLVIVVGEIDLSFGAMYGLAANSLAVMWILGGVPIYVAIPLAIGIGGLVGVFNGVLTTWLKIPSFIVTLGSYNLLYGLSLYVTNASTFNPGLSAGRLSRRPGPARLLQQSDPADGQPSVLRRGLLDDRPGAGGGLPAAPLAVRLPAHGDRRQSRGGPARPPAGAQIQDPGLRPLRHAGGDGGHPRFLLHPDDPARYRPLPDLPGLRRRHHRRRQPLRRQGHGDRHLGRGLLLAELQIGLALLSPGPYAQQLFLGAVTIGAVALDLGLTKLRARRAA